jgi:hypothetical protein
MLFIEAFLQCATKTGIFRDILLKVPHKIGIFSRTSIKVPLKTLFLAALLSKCH